MKSQYAARVVTEVHRQFKPDLNFLNFRRTLMCPQNSIEEMLISLKHYTEERERIHESCHN